MKNVKAYVRTTLTAGLILAAAVLGGCSKSDAGAPLLILQLLLPAPNLLLPPMLPILIRRSSNTEKLPVRTLSYLRMPSNQFWKKRAIHSPRLISLTFSRMTLL